MKKHRMTIYLIISGAMLLVAVFLLGFYHRPILSSYKTIDETKKMEEAKAYGDEVIGWLRVEGTNIDMPLIRALKGTDVLRDDYDFAWTVSNINEESTRPSFLSHNIRNVSSNPIVGDDTMRRFEQLMAFIYPEFIKENQYIEYTDSLGKSALYRIYAV